MGPFEPILIGFSPPREAEWWLQCLYPVENKLWDEVTGETVPDDGAVFAGAMKDSRVRQSPNFSLFWSAPICTPNWAGFPEGYSCRLLAQLKFQSGLPIGRN